MWIWGLNFISWIFLIYVVKKLSLWSKFTLEKEVLWFFSNGLLFRIFWTQDYWTTYLQVSESTFRYSGGFFCVRSYSHQVVPIFFHFWPRETKLSCLKKRYLKQFCDMFDMFFWRENGVRIEKDENILEGLGLKYLKDLEILKSLKNSKNFK